MQSLRAGVGVCKWCPSVCMCVRVVGLIHPPLPPHPRSRLASQVVTRLYASPLFAPAREPLVAALLSMLCARLYTAAQPDLVDTLYALAAANWTDFQLSLLPRWADAVRKSGAKPD